MKIFLMDALEKSQPVINMVVTHLQTICDDFLKAVDSWDYITITIVVALLVAALPSFLWIGMSCVPIVSHQRALYVLYIKDE